MERADPYADKENIPLAISIAGKGKTFAGSTSKMDAAKRMPLRELSRSEVQSIGQSTHRSRANKGEATSRIQLLR